MKFLHNFIWLMSSGQHIPNLTIDSIFGGKVNKISLLFWKYSAYWRYWVRSEILIEEILAKKKFSAFIYVVVRVSRKRSLFFSFTWIDFWCNGVIQNQANDRVRNFRWVNVSSTAQTAIATKALVKVAYHSLTRFLNSSFSSRTITSKSNASSKEKWTDKR